MRRGLCPDEYCGRPILLTAPATCAACRGCRRRPIPIDQLREAEVSNMPADHVGWMYSKAMYEEKNGKFSAGRLRVVNGMIDGLADIFHIVTLWAYFEQYGLDKDGQAKKLAEMGRMQPINVATFGDYAFAIRKEHVDVGRYGCDYSAARYLSTMISAVNEANGLKSKDGRALVPLVAYRRDAYHAISRAVTGREIFTKHLREVAFRHLKSYANHYKKLSTDADPEYIEVLSKVVSPEDLDPYVLPYDLELAVLSNVLFRPILLLDADPPFVKQIFLPRFCKPEDCRNRKGTKRPPLLLAWSDRTYSSMVALVSVATGSRINPMYLPRNWLRSVWAVTDQSIAEEMLKLYIEFTENDRCLVAHGKYFKPQFIRRVVNAFETKALKEHGIHPRLVANFVADMSPRKNVNVHLILMAIGTQGQLWRCTICETLAWNSSGMMDFCPLCGVLGAQRIQRLDGTIGYFDGDHTETAAPNSCCFTKRKHWYDGIEYDNPHFSIDLSTVKESIRWFYGDSDTRLNSRPDDVIEQLMKRCGTTGTNDRYSSFANSIKTEIVTKLSNDVFVQQQLQDHLWTTLGKTGVCSLFDDFGPKSPNQDVVPTKDLIKNLKEPVSIKKSPTRVKKRTKTGPSEAQRIAKIDEVCASINNRTHCYYKRVSQLKMMMAEKGETEELKSQMKEVDELHKRSEEVAIKSLDDAMIDCTQQNRWKLLCTKSDMFRLGGFFFHFAQRSGYRIGDHFSLPLLGDVKFAFADDDDSLVTCVPGGHFPPHESVELTCSLYSDDPGIFTKLDCDHIND